MRLRIGKAVRPLAAASLALLFAPAAGAHPLAPSLLELREQAAGRVAVVWKTPLLQPRGSALQPELPAACRSDPAAETRAEGAALRTRLVLDCGAAGLLGQRVAVRGLEQSGTNALVRVVRRDGSVVQALLDARAPSWVVPERLAPWRVLGDYLRLGGMHLAFGLDHVLFVLGLLLLVRGRRALLLTLSAFTLGHSVTLSLATLGFVRFPSGLVEVAIAASLVALAAEIPGRSDARRALFACRPWRAALLFGLLHGLGFAGALRAAGLPAVEIPLALLAFNVGIEVGQVALVALAWGIWRVARMLRAPLAPRGARLAAAYGIGTLAGYWVVARGAAALAELAAGLSRL